jgi:hypothetical protein
LGKSKVVPVDFRLSAANRMKPVGRGFDPHQELLASVAQSEEQLPQMYNLLNLVLDFFVKIG